MTDEAYAHRRPPSEGPSTPPQQAKLQQLCAHVFTAPNGRELMELLRKATIEHRMRSGASEAELREMEARRSLVFDLEKWRDAGIAALSKPKEPVG